MSKILDNINVYAETILGLCGSDHSISKKNDAIFFRYSDSDDDGIDR